MQFLVAKKIGIGTGGQHQDIILHLPDIVMILFSLGNTCFSFGQPYMYILAFLKMLSATEKKYCWHPDPPWPPGKTRAETGDRLNWSSSVTSNPFLLLSFRASFNPPNPPPTMIIFIP